MELIDFAREGNADQVFAIITEMKNNSAPTDDMDFQTHFNLVNAMVDYEKGIIDDDSFCKRIITVLS